MSNAKQTVPLVVSRITAMQAGFTKDFTAKMSLPVEGSSMGQPAILSQLETFLTVITEAEDARATLASKVAAKKAQMPAIAKFLSDLESSLKQTLGSGNPELQDFGIKPPKAKKRLTAQQKAVSTANAKATKAVRGIIGKTQRAKITTAGTPGVAILDAQGNVVPGLSTGPIPPGAREPLPVTGVAAVGGVEAAPPAEGAQPSPAASTK